MTELNELTKKAKRVIAQYKQTYPDVQMDRDYLPFKITEEWGECLQAFLMLTNRGRQKGKTKKDIQRAFENEFADVFGYILAFADQEGIDLEQALQQKWFTYLD